MKKCSRCLNERYLNEITEPVNFCDLSYYDVYYGNVFDIKGIKDNIKYILIENKQQNDIDDFITFFPKDMENCCTVGSVYFMLSHITILNVPCLCIFVDKESTYRYVQQVNLLCKLKGTLLSEDKIQQLCGISEFCFDEGNIMW